LGNPSSKVFQANFALKEGVLIAWQLVDLLGEVLHVGAVEENDLLPPRDGLTVLSGGDLAALP